MKGSWRRLGIGISSLLPVFAPAQNLPAGINQAPITSVQGTATIDLIRLQALGPGVPLRFGAITPNSERVEHNGQVLVRGTDYQIDYETGVVFLMRAQRAGQTLLVSYLYDKSKQGTEAKPSLATPTFKLNIGGEALKLIGGFGYTERLSDGNVLTSNLYGIQNGFGMFGGKMEGLMMVGERNKQTARSAFEFQANPGETETGESRAILQKFSGGFLGGKVNADYQDISQNFAATSALGQAGFDANQLKKERGLQRLGFSMQDLNVGGLKFSNSFKTVKNGDESVDWRSFGVAAGGLTFNWKSQSVGENFARFKDLGEGDREQLLKEAGLNRESSILDYKSKLGALSFKNNQVEDQSGNGIYRRELGFDIKNVRFLTVGDQTVDQQFNRFNSLFEPERGQWGREAGLKRQWMSLDASVLGSAWQGLKFSQNILRSPVGEYVAQDFSVGNKGWSLEHSARSSDKTFDRLGSMAEGEMDNNIRAIASMYQKDANLWRPEERRFFLGGAGLDRSVTRIGATPFKGWKMGFEHLAINGSQDDASVDTFTVDGKKFSMRYRRQDLGQMFNEVSNLMEFERQRLGTIAGLERSDFGFNLDFGRSSKIAFSTMSAGTAEGDARRTSASYSDGGKLDLQVNSREVDSAFNGITSLVDPERDLLASLKGFRERDVKGKWNITPNLTVDVFRFDAANVANNEDRMLQNVVLNWKPDKRTGVLYESFQVKNDDPLQVLFAQETDRLSLTRDLGKYGAFKYQKETIQFDGIQAQTRPDSNREYMAYETKVTPTTSVKTEQQRTRWDNGDKEDISANTVSADLTKRAGVSVTDVRIDRNGDERDERKRNYGFWLDFGRGVRLSYGYNRQMIGANGTQNLAWNLSQGTLGGFLNVGNASYTENRWDGLRTQAFSNVQLSSSKAFDLLFFKGLTVSYGQETASDYQRFIKDGTTFNAQGKLFGGSFGLNYRSQVAPDGLHGIDRTISYSTGAINAKRPWSADVAYKSRELPNGDAVMIRNYKFAVQPSRRFTLSNELLTNPEVPRGDVILGSLTDPWRVSRWRLDYKESADNTFGATWDEKRNDLTRELSRTTGLNLTLFQKSGSPLSFFYGIEEVDGRFRRRADRYFIKFDQRPGANQFLSFYVGNLSYEHSLPDGENRSNWTIRMDYRLRF